MFPIYPIGPRYPKAHKIEVSGKPTEIHNKSTKSCVFGIFAKYRKYKNLMFGVFWGVHTNCITNVKKNNFR